jgi:Fic family protein
MQRRYESTHPWLTFALDLGQAPPRLWIALGEAQSKCEHIAGVPLRPDIAQELHQVYLAKGIGATTAIEGNTLTEREVRARLHGKLKLPRSREYLGREVDNILSAANEILDEVEREGASDLTVETFRRYNRTALSNLELGAGVIPGETRSTPVIVGPYGAAPHEDCDYLMHRLCDWLNSEFFNPAERMEIVYGLLKSVIAHVYFVWIHPFADGNGRTARLVEVKFLLEAGVPSAAAHLLSNHYNLTRNEYYRQLMISVEPQFGIMPFLQYAVEGFVDQLAEHIQAIKWQQWHTTWVNYVYDIMGEPRTPAERRQIKLVLAMARADGPVERRQLRLLTPELAEAYAGKTTKTMTRDVNALVRRGLIRRDGTGYVADMEKILAFLPRGKRGGAARLPPAYGPII